MAVTISDDSANVAGLFADMLDVQPEDAIDLYRRLTGRRPTEADALDATIQAIFNARGPTTEDSQPLAKQPRSDFVARVVVEIRRTASPSLLSRIAAGVVGVFRLERRP